MAHWALFVDESGKFENAGDDVAVAGILMPAQATGLLASRVDQEVRAALPHVPPPPHRWLVEKHVAHLGWHALGGFKRVNPSRVEAHRHAASLLQRELPREWGALLDKLPCIDDEPPNKLLSQLANRLEALGASTAVRDETREALARVVRAVARIGEPVPGLPAAVIVGAGEETLASGSPDRYRSTLGATIERAADAVLALAGPGDHLLTVNAMRRPRSHLTEDGIAVLAHAAGLPRSRPDATVRLLAARLLDRYTSRDGEPKPYPKPWPVVCDWIAYTARRHVQRHAPWDEVGAGIEAELALRTSTGKGLPLFSSVGPCSSDWLSARRSGAPFTVASAPTRRWSADQASRWSAIPW